VKTAKQMDVKNQKMVDGGSVALLLIFDV